MQVPTPHQSNALLLACFDKEDILYNLKAANSANKITRNGRRQARYYSAIQNTLFVYVYFSVNNMLFFLTCVHTDYKWHYIILDLFPRLLQAF